MIVAFKLLIELIFVLVSEFEDKLRRLVICERLLAKDDARMGRHRRKDGHIRDISACSELLCYALFVRLTKQNHDLSLIAEVCHASQK